MKPLPTVDLNWPKAWRIISTRFPAIELFEEVADPKDWEALAELERLTNPRYLDEIGDLSLVPLHQRVSGEGASYVMSPFTHPRPGRFSTDAWGAFYAASTLDTAVAETVYHHELFYRDSGLDPLDVDVRVLTLRAQGTVHDLRNTKKLYRDALHLTDYLPSQRLAQIHRELGSKGILYPSVRIQGGECLAAFTPTLISHCRHLRYLCYRWDGQRISDIFEKRPFVL